MGGNHTNYSGLRPFAELSQSEAHAIRSKGAMAAAKVKREKRTRREIVDMMLSSKVSTDKQKAIAEILGNKEMATEANVFTMMAAGMVNAAAEGNSKAFEIMFNLAESGAAPEKKDRDALSAAMDNLKELLINDMDAAQDDGQAK